MDGADDAAVGTFDGFHLGFLQHLLPLCLDIRLGFGAGGCGLGSGFRACGIVTVPGGPVRGIGGSLGLTAGLGA
ncbi:MAG TPA: hypothetical protein H9878_10945, partial [Candidatus Dietzia merdigallinarum]|nr:hypothetical protein [Candidatus Dietzia merdigallinarum]